MQRRRFLLFTASFAWAWATAHAQQSAQKTLKVGQRVVASFVPTGTKDALQGEFAVTEVKGVEIAGRFSGHLCGPNVYDFSGRFDGEVLEANSTSRWGPISVFARRTSENRFSGSYTGRYPGAVEIEIRD